VNDKYPLLRVLHLASFAGNIGDLANHFGARKKMRELFDFRFDITELEIREFYWKQKTFDADFIRYANSFDLLIIGGGNYFELWVGNSATGTSIDIKPEDFANLKTPTIFYSLGVDIGQGCSEQSSNRFKAFLNTSLERKNIFLSVRNDGSKHALNKVAGTEISEQIPVIADGGFFAGIPALPAKKTAPVIGINLAGDMLEQRFNGDVSPSDFLNGLGKVCMDLIDQYPGLKIEIIPHIWKDIVFISRFLDHINDPYIRRYIRIASLDPTLAGLESFLTEYRKYDLVLGTRFHANVCPIGMHIPTRGLVCYSQIKLLYEELNFLDRIIDVTKLGFENELRNSISEDLVEKDHISAQYKLVLDSLNQETDGALLKMNDWLHTNLDR
jgi:polysaccharide pyruvyl transferase WcaK-like protein